MKTALTGETAIWSFYPCKLTIRNVQIDFALGRLLRENILEDGYG